jgi:probable HAF family extracellular repeat protein
MANHRTARVAAQLCGWAWALGALTAGPAAHAAPTYHLIDLGPNTTAVDLNHKGHVVGAYDRLGGKVGVWRDGAWQPALPDSLAIAKGIGREDVIALNLRLINGLETAGAVLPDGQLVDFRQQLGTDSSSAAAATSDGTVVGYFFETDGAYSFTYRDGTVTKLPCTTEHVSCMAHAASPTKGFIAGIGPRKDAEPWFIAAIVFDGTSWKDLGTLGGWVADVSGVNRKGHVVGSSELRPNNHRTHAFIHAGKFMKDLHTLGGRDSHAYAINAQDVVVGRSEVPERQDSAFYWDGSGPMIDLNTLVANLQHLHLVDAVGINEDGWIVGNARGLDGSYHGYLLKPQSR